MGNTTALASFIEFCRLATKSGNPTRKKIQTPTGTRQFKNTRQCNRAPLAPILSGGPPSHPLTQMYMDMYMYMYIYMYI